MDADINSGSQPKADKKKEELSQAVINFDLLPDSANVGIKDASIVAGRAKPTLYRDAAKGLIKLNKIGHSTRIRVGELRRYLNGIAA